LLCSKERRSTIASLGSPARIEGWNRPRHPPFTFAFHDKATIPGGLVRKILVRDVGLDEEEARKLL
jgi:hypothetical protein